MNKRLYKSEQNKQIAGVCQGIAEYFDIDPTLVRLAFAISLVFAGTGFWVYIIMSIVLPEKREVMHQYQEEKEEDAFERYDDYEY